ncbi:MAG: hypothetical protein ABI702_19585 [Burkholderiales bacterium]
MSIEIGGPQQMAGFIPERCVIFLSDSVTGGPLAGVPVGLRARYRVTWPAASSTGSAVSPTQSEFLLGILATDHVGYASWDLAPLITRFKLLIDEIGGQAERPLIELDELKIRLAGPLSQEVDALDDAQLGSNAFSRSYSTDLNNVYQLAAGTYPAVQNPSLIDWVLSPASFAYLPTGLIGQDGCEALLPSNVATQRFKAYQVVNPTIPSESPEPGVIAASIADLLTYSVAWLPIGHGLGQVLYSMPLAPGEQVNIAIVDWARTDKATRQEQTGLTDTLTHDTIRDRTVAEVVDSSLREYQRGSTTMGGGSIAGGAAGYLGVALSLGSSYSTSSGQRDLSANTTQSLTDQFHQASAAIRDLRSTVVVQATQEVAQQLQTRTVRNHNHSHALTLLYYEVLRHYRVVTELIDVGPALLWTETPTDFATVKDVDTVDVSPIFRYRRFLEPALLLPELKGGFDAIEKLFSFQPPQEPPPPPPPPAPPPPNWVLFNFRFRTGGVSGRCRVTAHIRDSQFGVLSEVPVQALDGSSPDDPSGGKGTLADVGAFDANDRTIDAQGIAGSGISWDHAGFVIFAFEPQGHDVGINLFEVRATAADGAEHLLHSSTPDVVFHQGASPMNLEWAVRLTAPPPPAPAPAALTPLQRLSPEERSLRARLISHLNENKAYYWRQIWMGEDPNARRIRWEPVRVSVAGRTVNLLDAVENRVVDVLGNQLVLPLDPGLIDGARGMDVYGPAQTETLLSLPTRGVFGEAKLGHCNASEIIDNTRFWDWQSSPIPEDAPSITGVTPQGTGTGPGSPAPTALPASLVSQAMPVTEPDPIGLKAALEVLKTPGVFNNLSGIESLKGLLTSLSDAAAKVATKDKNSSGDKGSGSGSGSDPGTGTGASGSGGSSGSTGGSGTGSSSTGGTAGAADGSNGGGSGAQTPPIPIQPSPKVLPTFKRRISLAFVYSNQEPLMGNWDATLRCGNTTSESFRQMINDVDLVSGVAVGNRMEMVFDSDFGGTADLALRLEGSIRRSVPSLSDGANLIQFVPYEIRRVIEILIPRTSFDANPSYTLSQKLETGGFDLEIQVDRHSVGAVISNTSGPISPQVELVRQVTIPDSGINPRTTVSLSSVGLHSVSLTSHESLTAGSTTTDKLQLKVMAISSAPPDVL